MCGRMYEIKIRLPKQIALTISFEYVAINKEIPRQAFLPISVSLLPLLMLRFDVFWNYCLINPWHCVGVLFYGGEGEIRTLEPISGLRDFQSRALDQLRDFSSWLTAKLYHREGVLSIPNRAFLDFIFHISSSPAFCRLNRVILSYSFRFHLDFKEII